MSNILILNLPGPVYKAGTRWPSKVKFRKAQIKYYPYPWFMGYATSLLKTNGYQVYFKDAVAMEWSEEQTRQYINKLKPKYLICEPTAISIESDVSFLKRLADQIILIAVGQYATNQPYDCIKKGFDYAVIGEYEFPLLEFFNSLGQKLPSNFVSKQKTDYSRGDLVNVDSLPFPERDDVPIKYYNEPSCYGRNVVMVSSRGCRLDCSYCLIHSFYGKKSIRTRSPESVVDEMEYLKKHYSFDQIYFDDDNIVAKQGHLEAICNEIIKRNLAISWVCMGDALIPLRSIERLAQAGCKMYKFGVEHFDEEVLKAIPKPITFRRVSDLVEECKKNKIKTHLTFMVGLPESTFQKDLDMVKKVIQINPTAVQFAIATPYPGTRFYRKAKEEGWLLKDDLSIYDAAGCPAISYPNYMSSEIEEMYHLAWKMWRRHVILTQPSTTLFFFSSNLRREGFIKTFIMSYEYLKEAINKNDKA